MKKLFLLSAVLAAGLLTSCSSDKEVDNPFAEIVNSEGDAYVNIALNLPMQDITRAAGIEDVDGETNEYAVNDAIIAVFAGDNENDATFRCATQLTSIGTNIGSTSEITAIYKQTASIDKSSITGATHIYLYAILNGLQSGAFSYSSPTLTINTATPVALSSSISFQTFKGYVLDAAKIGEPASGTTKGFLMVNAPLASKAGGSSDPSSATITWLSELKATDIYATVEEAAAGNATEIYVERAAAKVQLTVASSLTLEGNTSISINQDLVKWQIDNTETTFFGTRNITNTAFGSKNQVSGATGMTYRFVDDRATATNLYRIHWAEDPHYSKGASGTDWTAWNTWDDSSTPNDASSFTNIAKTVPASALANANGGVAYCTENTCKWNEQKKSTRVIVAIPFNVSGTTVNAFYTIPSVTGQDVIYQDLTAVGTALADVVKSTAAYADFLTKVQAAVSAASKTYDETKATVTVTVTNNSDNISASATAVTLTYSNDGVDYADATNNSGANNTAAQNAIKDIAITYYSTGYAFYKILIQHFGQDDTWLNPSTTETTYTGLYGTTYHDRDYLGRFGVVRNHWYQLNVSGIRHIGSPDVPTIPTTPDDEIGSYISCKINITKWAKHTQSGVKI